MVNYLLLALIIRWMHFSQELCPDSCFSAFANFFLSVVFPYCCGKDCEKSKVLVSFESDVFLPRHNERAHSALSL